MRELHISKNDADQRVDKFLTKALPTLPKSLLYKYIRNKKIKVNRKRCEISQRLQEGDVLQCYIAEEFFPEVKRDYAFLHVPSELTIVYEDEDIIAVYKPIDLLVQKDQPGIQDNLNDRLLHYLYQQGSYDPKKEQSFTPAFAHRLDRNTEGLLLAGKNAEAVRMLNEKLRTHEIKKYYLALVEGTLPSAQGELCFYHRKQGEINQAELFDEPVEGTTRIETSYRVLHTYQQMSLVEVELHTGKSHQIRASFAHIGHPLVGDVKYGARSTSKYPYQALCAYKIKFGFTSSAGALYHLKHKELLLKNSALSQYITTLRKV